LNNLVAASWFAAAEVGERSGLPDVRHQSRHIGW
jgi:hypothetical protein